jgi:2-methylisocitrate lyase-like PEP mutase family enzyme
MRETVPAFEEAGVAAIHIEDHTGAGKHTDAPQELRQMKEAAELAAVRRRIAKPVMIVDMPGRTLEEHAGAAIVLYYAFSVTRQFSALKQALAARGLASDTRPLEDFLGYKDAPGRSA